MGRRSFAKITKNLDLSSRIRKGDETPRPWNTLGMFGRTAPVEFEIGSGKGMFLANAAAADPSRDFIGVEVAYRYALMSAAGLVKAGLKNALMVCADAAKLLEDWVPSSSLVAVHVYFPDPWWKKSHRKRRIMRTDVVRMIEDRLLPGGKLWFRTDVEEYFFSALDTVKVDTSLEGPFPDPRLPRDPEVFLGGLSFSTDGVGADSGGAVPETGGCFGQDPDDPFRSGENKNLPYYGENGNQNPPVPRAGRGEFLSHFERRTRLNGLPVWGAVFVKPVGKATGEAE